MLAEAKVAEMAEARGGGGERSLDRLRQSIVLGFLRSRN